MSKGFLHGGGGGTPLNFNVVGNPQPTNPKENTIWLNTDVPIGRWYFSATQPEGLNAGDVWFPVGTYSPVAFNTLKKNGVMVYPISAKQHISGALVDKTAKIYQGGKWLDWVTYLYNRGDQCISLTGGWVAYAYKSATSGSTEYKPTVTFETDYLRIHMPHPGNSTFRQGCVFAEKAIDMTNLKSLSVDVKSFSGSGGGGVAVELTKTKQNKYSKAASITITGTGTFTTDVSALSGSYYVALVIGGVGNASTAYTVDFASVYG